MTGSEGGGTSAEASRTWIAFLALVVLTVLAVFSGVLSADFVMWDDDVCIYQNPGLRGLSLQSLSWALTDVDSTMRYMPLSLLSWSGIYHFFGLNPLGYHLANWTLHGLGSGVLFLALRQLIAAHWRVHQGGAELPQLKANLSAFLATLLWALHPLRVEPVAWATDLPYCQAILFLFLSLLVYLRAVQPDRSDRDRRRFIRLSALLYLASLLSHPVGATYFVVLSVLDVCLLRRIGGDTGWWSQKARAVWREKALFALPALLLALVTIVLRVQSAGKWSPPVALIEFGLLERAMQVVYVFVYYLYKPFYPASLAPVYTTLFSFDPLTPAFVLRACFLTGLSAVLIRYRRRFASGAALFLSYLILTAPVVGFFEHPYSHVDRYSHLPSVLWSVLAAFACMRLRNHRLAKGGLCFSLLALCLLAGFSVFQTRVWNNSETLFAHTLQTLGDDPYRKDIYWRLGKHRLLSGKRELAVESFEQALKIDEHHPMANGFLVHMAEQDGDLTKATFHLEKLLISRPNDAKARIYLIGLYSKLRMKKEEQRHRALLAEVIRSGAETPSLLFR